ncbi:uncharacterized protein N7459_004013 [Penicillium hispanicum]|uniref:uncharacterized protein n=1 Tax=Penicillium hispanicum TaxID=1080232 RepID=UPI002540915F|nr:uncharacterized protein N7459_004013 [Penicillium hispanicum]KAJ5584213.1 hypothetical protein N7459_004013 [Penicillium hispanicum]
MLIGRALPIPPSRVPRFIHHETTRWRLRPLCTSRSELNPRSRTGKMPIPEFFSLPATPKQLTLPESADPKLFIAFVSSKDPNTKLPWCPDVRAALPHLQAAFAEDSAPNLAIVEVGQQAEDPKNISRTSWNVTNVPTLVRYQRVNGAVAETGRLIEGQILDKAGLQEFISASAREGVQGV